MLRITVEHDNTLLYSILHTVCDLQAHFSFLKAFIFSMPTVYSDLIITKVLLMCFPCEIVAQLHLFYQQGWI